MKYNTVKVRHKNNTYDWKWRLQI